MYATQTGLGEILQRMARHGAVMLRPAVTDWQVADGWAAAPLLQRMALAGLSPLARL